MFRGCMGNCRGCGQCGFCANWTSPCGYPCGFPCNPCAQHRAPTPCDFCPFPEPEPASIRDDPAVVVCPPGTYRLPVPGREPEPGARVCAEGTSPFINVRNQTPPREWEVNRRTAVKDLLDPKIPQACYDSSICAPLGFPRKPTRNPNCGTDQATTSTQPQAPCPAAPGPAPGRAPGPAPCGAVPRGAVPPPKSECARAKRS